MILNGESASGRRRPAEPASVVGCKAERARDLNLLAEGSGLGHVRALAFVLLCHAPLLLVAGLYWGERQQFALSDDWIWYRLATRPQSGCSEAFPAHAMTLVGHLTLVQPFFALLGTTWGAARFSTIVWSLLGALMFYLYLRDRGLDARSACGGVGCLVLGPVYTLTAGTFQTDVPALSFAIMGVVGFERCLRSASPAAVALAFVGTAVAASIRQTALAIPIVAAAMALSSTVKRREKLTVIAIAVSTILIGVGLYVYARTLPTFVEVPMSLGINATKALFLASLGVVIGFACWPVFAAEMVRRWRPVLATAAIFVAVAIVVRVRRGYLLGFAGNSVNEIEGPELVFLLVVGAPAAAMALRSTGMLLKHRPGVMEWFMLSNAVLLPLPERCWDRYSLPLLPGVLCLCLSSPRLRRVHLGALAVQVALSFLLLEQTYFEQSARWTLARGLVATGVAPRDISVDWTWKGHHNPASLGSSDSLRPTRYAVTTTPGSSAVLGTVKQRPWRTAFFLPGGNMYLVDQGPPAAGRPSKGP